MRSKLSAVVAAAGCALVLSIGAARADAVISYPVTYHGNYQCGVTTGSFTGLPINLMDANGFLSRSAPPSPVSTVSVSGGSPINAFAGVSGDASGRLRRPHSDRFERCRKW
jgi:hypothetical protein